MEWKHAWSSSPGVSAEGKVQNSVTVEQHWKEQKIFLPAKLHKEYLDTQRSPLKFDLHTTVDVNKARSKHKAGLS